jgi:hypothetical protein
MDSPETRMASASFSRHYGRRVDERCVQHLFRTGIHRAQTFKLNQTVLNLN